MDCGEKFCILYPLYYSPILPYKYPYIYYYFNILFYIIEFFHKVVNRDMKRLEMNELWRGQKSKNVEIYFNEL